jgi:hypothetical protein
MHDKAVENTPGTTNYSQFFSCVTNLFILQARRWAGRVVDLKFAILKMAATRSQYILGYLIFVVNKFMKNLLCYRMYRLNPQRELGNLFSVNDGCPYLQAGITNISFVKDLMTQTALTNTFKCSKFGQHVHHTLGWVSQLFNVLLFHMVEIKYTCH